MTSTVSANQYLMEQVLSDARRLKAVENTTLAIAKNDQRFQPLAAIAATAFDAPVAQVTLMGDDTQWFKASIGFDIAESGTNTSFCAHAIAVPELPLVVYDTFEDDFFSKNPFVANPPHVRFYAGYPIIYGGEKVGTVCVYDFQPREVMTAVQKKVLVEVSQRATELILIIKGD
ncbi:MAG: GAF domain-containing protein [Pseudomonadota bacterium]